MVIVTEPMSRPVDSDFPSQELKKHKAGPEVNVKALCCNCVGWSRTP